MYDVVSDEDLCEIVINCDVHYYFCVLLLYFTYKTDIFL